MANQPDTLNLNYSRLEDVPEEITDDKQYQKHLCKLYLKQNLIETLVGSSLLSTSLIIVQLYRL